MKRNHSRAVHKWPRGGYKKPGPKNEYHHIHSSVRLTDDQLAMIQALSVEFDVPYSEVFRRGLQLLYDDVYSGTNGEKFVDPCCTE